MSSRYSRQRLIFGADGQRRIERGFATVIGCGALGTVAASLLVRAGVGTVRIVDRDFIEEHNLQRQFLFDEEDIRDGLPKAVAAERKLRKINSTIHIEGITADVNPSTVEGLVRGAHVIVDGLDNFETRLLINDVALKHGIPWVYGGAVATVGMTRTIIPHRTSCFRCLFGDEPSTGRGDTCDTAGILGPASAVIGAIQAAEALKILAGNTRVTDNLLCFDLAEREFTRFEETGAPGGCPACRGRYDYLDGNRETRTTVLCGQNAVQVTDPDAGGIDLPDLAERLSAVGTVTISQFMLKFSADGRQMVVFPDGRAIIKGTDDVTAAKGFYAKYIGM